MNRLRRILNQLRGYYRASSECGDAIHQEARKLPFEFLALGLRKKTSAQERKDFSKKMVGALDDSHCNWGAGVIHLGVAAAIVSGFEWNVRVGMLVALAPLLLINLYYLHLLFYRTQASLLDALIAMVLLEMPVA